MSKYIISCLLFVLTAGAVKGQIIESPKWTYKFSKNSVKVCDEVEVIFSTDAPTDWYIYSTNVKCEVGPIKASLVFKKNDSYKLIGTPYSVGDKKSNDEVFGCPVGKFYHHAEIRQKIKILKSNPLISAYFEGQMCTDKTGQCVPISSDMLTLKGLSVTGTLCNDKLSQEIENSHQADTPAVKITSAADSVTKTVAEKTYRQLYRAYNANEIGKCEVKTFKGAASANKEESYWSFLILAFLSGLAALLTPCVFPMIPMTVSFFMKDKKSKRRAIINGLIYGLSIILIYTLIGTFVAVVFGADAANWLSTHWIPNVFFFVIFVVFAASFFGAFEITLPSKFVNKIDQKADGGGIGGTFFMAFTLVLVSFSCTGPIVGSILVSSVGGEFIKPLIGMFGFSLAFAVPFALFAIFPQWLSSLPKSGGWLNSVKVCLGFIELALGLKFLSVADQTYHWHILDREIYLALWIVIFFLMGVYLLGKLKFSHDSDLPYLKVPRLLLAISTFAFVVYMIPGMWGAPLKGLAGYLPPMHSQDFSIVENINHAKGIKGTLCETPKYGETLHVPQNLAGYFDYEQGLECAKKTGKPLFIDFTGHGCVNCRKMEENVWSDPQVLKILSEDYVILSLYVDDKKIKLSTDEYFISKFDGKEVTTLGKKNTAIQQCMFGTNSQPQYVLLDHNQELLATPAASDFSSDNIKNFIKFLEAGKAEFKIRTKK